MTEFQKSGCSPDELLDQETQGCGEDSLDEVSFCRLSAESFLDEESHFARSFYRKAARSCAGAMGELLGNLQITSDKNGNIVLELSLPGRLRDVSSGKMGKQNSEPELIYDRMKDLLDLVRTTVPRVERLPEPRSGASVGDTTVRRPARPTDARGERPETAAPADLTAERDRLLRLARERMTPEELRQFQENMTEFENRTGKPALSSREIAATYREISRLLTTESSVGLSRDNMKTLAFQTMAHAARPTSIDQGQHPTCNVTTIEVLTFAHNPKEAARLIADAATTGTYRTTADGTTVRLRPEDLRPDQDARTGGDGRRTYASQLFQLTAANIKWQRVNPDYRYVQVDRDPQLQGDYGDRILNVRTNEYLANRDGTPRRHPGFTATDHVDVLAQITGGDQRGSTIVRRGESDGSVIVGGVQLRGPDQRLASVESAEQLGALLSRLKEQGKLPAIVCIYCNKEPFRTDAGGAAGGGGGHVVTIWDYDARTGRVAIDNQWGSARDRLGSVGGSDRRLTLAELFSAMSPDPRR